jgi:hypothetical protein
MGLAALLRLLGNRRGPGFDARHAAAPFRPLITLFSLIAAFVALGVILTVLSAIAALGSGGALVVGCGMPVMLIVFIAWVISQRPKQQAVPRSDPWTIDGTASQASDGRQDWIAPAGAARPTVAMPTAAAPHTQTATAAPSPRTPVQEEKGRHAGKAAAKSQPIPERPVRTPAEYRQRAASYRRKIQSLIKSRRPGPIAERMTGVLQKLKSWEERVGQLSDRVALYENDDLIQRDVREAPIHIDRLRRQLSLEADPDMQRQVRRTLAAYEEQQRQLELLARVMKRTRLNLDDTLAAMGTVYSQLQVLNAMDIDGPTAARIAGDVDREIERLNDLLAATSEVYGHSSEVAPEPADPAENGDAAGLANRKSRLGDNSAR